MYSDRIDRAAQLAAVFHQNQFRKNPETRIPYIYHVMAVGMMVAHYGYPEDAVIAGILHDIVEDTEMNLAQVRKEFGDEVASLVEANSEMDKKLPWEQRKTLLMEKLRAAGEDAQAISCCGIMHNMKSIIRSLRAGSNIWGQFKRGKEQQFEHYTKMLEVFKATLKPGMVGDYESTFKELKDLCHDSL